MSIEHAVSETPRLRERLDALTRTVLSAVEETGPVAADGTPNPLLGDLTALLRAGTDYRQLALDRRLSVGHFEQRPAN
jgi:hypothetical protein